MLYGWKGKILRVNLANKKITKQDLPEEWMKKFMGCRGIQTKIMWDEVGPEVDPFSPDNKLIFGTGPLEGTPLGMGRVSVQTKHPKRFIGEGGAAGYWAPELKFAGYDFVVIEKKSDEPVYVFIDDDRVEIRDAKHLWGKDNRETNKLLKQELGREFVISSIGPANENLVANSKITFDANYCGGRGCGEIMGDKKLKAIAVHGTGGVSVKDPEGYLRAYRGLLKCIDIRNSRDPNPVLVSLFHAHSFLKNFNEMGWLHACNAQRGRVENPLSEIELIEKYAVRPSTSFGCPFPACGRRYEVKEGKYAGITGDDREAGFSLGAPIVGINDWPTIFKVKNLCDRYGLDEFMVLYTIGWAMECYQRGIITKEDTGGLELKFGDKDTVVELTEKIARREGFGDILANGSQKAAEIIGKGSERYLLTVKGREMDLQPIQAVLQSALCIAVCEGGTDHTRWYPPYPSNPRTVPQDISIPFDPVAPFKALSPEGKAPFAKYLYDKGALIENLPTCIAVNRERALVDLTIWLDIYNATTGANCNADEFLKIGERTVNLERAYIAREGFRRKDDTLPRRMLEEPAVDASLPPIGENLDIMLDEYYTLRGWDVKTGIPKEGKLRELDLDFVIDDLKKLK